MATHYLPLHQIFIFQHTLTYPIYPPPYRFNTATRRWLVAALNQAQTAAQFQHAAARRWLANPIYPPPQRKPFQHTATRRWLAHCLRHGHRRLPVSTHSHPKVAGASLKSLAPSGFAAPISLSSQEKREHEYNTALSVTPVFAIS